MSIVTPIYSSEVAALLEDLGRKGFYGDIVVQMQNGRIIAVKRNEMLKSLHNQYTSPVGAGTSPSNNEYNR